MWLGSFEFGTTVGRKFTTVGTSGAPTALSSAAVTVYRTGSTARTSSGVTLTASYDAITGLNNLQIDLSTAGFFAQADNYQAVISSGGTAVADLAGYVIAEWSLRNRFVGLQSTVGLETVSTVGLETLSTVGIETVSTAGLETAISSDVAAQVWNTTRANFTAAGSFGQLVSTSTAAPDQWVAGPFSTHSTAGLETLSTVGLETLSSAVVAAAASSALEAANLDHLLSAVGTSDHVVDGSLWTKLVSSSTSFVDYDSTTDSLGAIRRRGDSAWLTVSTAGLETLSTVGIETVSTAGLETAISSDVAAQVWNTTRANFTASGSFGQLVSTSTADPSIWANSAAGSPSSDIAAQVWNTTRANFTASGSFGQIVSTSTADPSIWANSAAGSPTSDIAAQVWNTTRANFTAAGSFGQIVSTSTAAPDLWVAGPFSTHSTAGLETLSTAGIETVSTVGLETVSSAVVAAAASSAIEAANLDHLLSAAGSSDDVADNSLWTRLVSSSTSYTAFASTLASLSILRSRGDAAWTTVSTVGLETLSTVGLETLSTAGIETVSTAGLETASSLVDVANISTAAAVQVNAEVVDAINTDTYEEPSAGTPSTAQTFVGMSRYIFSALRNQITVSASAKVFYNDANAVLWGKVLSQDTTGSTGVYTEAGASTST